MKSFYRDGDLPHTFVHNRAYRVWRIADGDEDMSVIFRDI
jgi:hypothetical protein